MKVNKVYLVGAGPGGSDLITVRGLEILRQADVVVYDYLVDKRLLEQTKKGTELICADKLAPRRYSDGFAVRQEKINELMVRKAKEGKRIVRLKNGDPSIFGRLSQELDVLVKEKIEFEIVPGVTAASLVSSLSGVPLTDRRFSSSVVFVTGHEDVHKKKSNIDWKAIANIGTVVLYMAVENISKISKELIRAGKAGDTPVMVVSGAGGINQRVVRAQLKDIAGQAKKEKIRAPAIFIIGRVVELGEKFKGPRKNRRILFTGLSKERFFLKGTHLHLPLIKIIPRQDYRELDGLLRKIKTFDWIVFTSRYGAEYFFKRLKAIGGDVRGLQSIKIAAIGRSTSNRLDEFGVLADLVAKKESSQGLLEEFERIDIKGGRIFLPRSDISDKGLAEGLERLGAQVTSGVAYRNVIVKDLPELDLNSFDEVMFSSPSGVRSFIKRYKNIPKKVKVNCIGDVTRREARKWHLLN